MRLALAAVLLAALPAVASASQAADRGTATITTRTGERVVLQVEILSTRAERQKGLMYRRSLPARAGMVFRYPEDVTGGFWMKNTLIPLDIAFYDARGRIRRILTMTPCRRDPCRIYSPGVAYRAAIEVNAGSFRRWNVEAGDRIAVRITQAG
jgi:uncharacterized membrane protein (UPF0127 family)